MAVRWFVCQECGIQFQRRVSQGQVARFCSNRCCGLAVRKKQPIVCQHCGRTFLPKEANRATFCSRECAFAHKTAEKQQREAGRLAGIGASSRIWVKECAECGQLFVARNANQTLCSEGCEKARNRRRFSEHKHEIGRDAGRLEHRTCRECGAEFDQVVFNQLKEFCSKRCARRNWERLNPETAAQMKAKQQHVRRARKKGAVAENINPRAVYERDGWKCGICGRKVNPRLRFPHPMSGSLDHIQPLAAGGTHTWGDVQCAHFICNSKKGAADGGQLKLLATVG